jgi:hypothetical protein
MTSLLFIFFISPLRRIFLVKFINLKSFVHFHELNNSYFFRKLYTQWNTKEVGKVAKDLLIQSFFDFSRNIRFFKETILIFFFILIYITTIIIIIIVNFKIYIFLLLKRLLIILFFFFLWKIFLHWDQSFRVSISK